MNVRRVAIFSLIAMFILAWALIFMSSRTIDWDMPAFLCQIALWPLMDKTSWDDEFSLWFYQWVGQGIIWGIVAELLCRADKKLKSQGIKLLFSLGMLFYWFSVPAPFMALYSWSVGNFIVSGIVGLLALAFALVRRDYKRILLPILGIALSIVFALYWRRLHFGLL